MLTVLVQPLYLSILTLITIGLAALSGGSLTLAIGLSVICLMLILVLQAISFEAQPVSTLSVGIIVCALEFAVQRSLNV